MAIAKPKNWASSLAEAAQLAFQPGCCERCGTFYQADPRARKKAPQLELCLYCAPLAEVELQLLNPTP